MTLGPDSPQLSLFPPVTETGFAPDTVQRSVLDHRAGPLLVTGGPGTGKTSVLVERFARLIEEGADPEHVALLVGSRRARSAVRARLLDRLEVSLPRARVLTVHALALEVLSDGWARAAYDRPPQVLGAAEQLSVVRDLLAGEDLDDWPAYGSMLGLRGFADEVRQLLLRAQEALLGPEDMLTRADAAGLRGWVELARFYRRYLDILGARGQVDFAGLVAQAAAVRSADQAGDPRSGGGAVSDVEHLMVDDYQEATFAAEQMVVGSASRSLVVVGDAGSHVFSFQGTTDVPLRRFLEVAGGAHVELTVPHRTSAAMREAWATDHRSEEHEVVARELRRIHVHEGVPWEELAVVVRRHGERLGGVLRALDDAGVPRAVPDRGSSLLEEPAVQPFRLGLEWVARPDERDARVEAILTSDLVRLSPALARGMVRAARAGGEPASAALDHTEDLTEAEVASVMGLRQALAAAEGASSSVQDAFSALWRGLPSARRMVDEAGDSPGGRRDLDAIVALSNAVAEADQQGMGVAAFLEILEAGEDVPELFGAEGEAEGAVSVLTAHATTGREFDTVLVVGVEEGDFPSLTRPEPMFDLAALEGRRSQSERNRLRLEDERRLFSVVATRARRRTVLLAADAAGRVTDGGAGSRFAAELGLVWSASPYGAVRDVEALDEGPLTVAEAEATWRRRLADLSAPAPDRLAALRGLVALGAQPDTWWFQRDWTGLDRPLHEEIRTSFSRLEKLENCALQYVLSEELGLDDRAGYHAWVGHLVHRLIEDCEEGLIERSGEALVRVAEERWRPAEFPSHAVSEAFRRLVTKVMIPIWVEEYGPAPAVATETHFLFPYDGATVSGYIDRIGPASGGGSVITDYKTGRARDLTKPLGNLQLGIYYLAVSEAPELEEHRPVKAVELVYLREPRKSQRDGGKVARAHLAILNRERDEYEGAVRTRLSGLIERVKELNKTENYPPNPRADCMFCRFRSLCPIWPEGGEVFPTAVARAEVDA